MAGIIASGVFKQLIYKRNTAKGTIAGPAGGKSMRRVSSNLDLAKASFQSNEIKTSQQTADMRHGVRTVDGTINGELSVGTYQDFFESTVRQNVVTAATSGALTDVVAATTTANLGTLTRGTGSWLTAGFKIGMVVRVTGFTTTGVANNTKNLVITSLTATVMGIATLNGSAVAAKAAGDSVTVAEVGKHTFVPSTGHTRDYYTFEHWFGDIGQSEVFNDCVVTQMDVKLPASGMATIDTMLKGLNMSSGTAQYFTSPSAPNPGRNLAAVNGLVYVAGQPVALITGMNFSIKGGHTTIGGVVGSNFEPDIFPGRVTVDGQLTVLFLDATFRDYFVDETEVSIFSVFTTGNLPASDFIGFTMPRIKVGGASKDDGEKGLVLTMPFTALENDQTGGANAASLATTIMIQDSTFV